ncbi:MAG: hypothetical protein ACLFMO_04555 [Eubacteriales bacterium]
MKKFKIITITFILVSFFNVFTSLTYASPEQEDKENITVYDDKGYFLDYFNIDEGMLVEQMLDNNTKDNINDLKYFRFIQGFNKITTATFEDEKYLVGEGEKGAEVGVFIYSTVDRMIKSDFSIQEIGASGLFNYKINLNDGNNNVIVAVKYKDDVIFRQFTINKKAKESLQFNNFNLFQIIFNVNNDKLSDDRIIYPNYINEFK